MAAAAAKWPGVEIQITRCNRPFITGGEEEGGTSTSRWNVII